MDVVLPKIQLEKTKIILVFFCVLYFVSCVHQKEDLKVQVLFKDEKAVSALFSANAKTKELGVFLKGSSSPVLGDFSSNGNERVFTPTIPFTNGQHYIINHNEKLLVEFTVKTFQPKEVPKLKAIYPSTDTVPQNLLKMYFVFSEPMQEVGNSLDFISITDNYTGKRNSVFLELPSELWNKEHTRLTLWLDPGRIKTDLIPNKKEGLPLKEGRNYTLRIAENLKSAKGVKLNQSYSKDFFVSTSDRQKPDSFTWQISPPKKDSKGVLEIKFNEPMDGVLAKEVISITDNSGKTIRGRYELVDHERQLNFYPETLWYSTTYEITVRSLLEDLAGNNLNHLFDSDVENNSKKEAFTKTKKINFSIK